MFVYGTDFSHCSEGNRWTRNEIAQAFRRLLDGCFARGSDTDQPEFSTEMDIIQLLTGIACVLSYLVSGFLTYMLVNGIQNVSEQ